MTGSEPKPTSKRFALPVHPILFAIFPLLALYARNLDQLPIVQLLRPLATALVLMMTAWAVLFAIYRHIRKAAVGASAVLIAFSLYGHLLGLSGNQFQWVIAASELLLIGIVLFALFKTRQPLRDTTAALNVAAAFLVASSCWVIGVAFWRASRPGNHVGEHIPLVAQPQSGSAAAHPQKKSSRVRGAVTAKTAALPDVYYIILDAHARADSLKYFYGYDESWFIQALEKRGFYVASQSRANYDETPLCLASSLNFTYLDALAKRAGPGGSLEACRQLLDDNKTAAQLSPLGYRYVYIGCGIGQATVETADMELNQQADVPLAEDIMNPALVNPNSPLHRPRYDEHRKRVIGVFDNLDTVAQLPFKKFVFAHALSPHPPFVLGPNGEAVYQRGGISFADGSWLRQGISQEKYIQGYIDQLQYVDKRTIQAIDRILSQSRKPPVIIIQGDHGSRMNLDWDSIQKTDLREPFSILNAYYVPQKMRDHLYATISPVNSFRLLFNDVFGANYKLLPDRSYYSTASEPYGFIDVTARSGMPLGQSSH